jgi:hypothetical protein
VLCSRVSQCWTIVFHVVPDQTRVVPDPMSGFQSKFMTFQTLSRSARLVSCAELHSQVPEYISSVARDVSAKAVVPRLWYLCRLRNDVRPVYYLT